jgi:hypothetical protein
LQKYWLAEQEYLSVWRPIQDEIFIQDKGLPDLAYRPEFGMIALRDGCLFLGEDFKHKPVSNMIKITEKEREAVSSLDTYERYKYFVKRVADTELMYSLKSLDGNWAISEVETSKLFPLWSAKEFADQCRKSGWYGFVIEEIDLETFEDDLLDFIHSEGYLLNVFPVGQNTGFVVDIVEFAKDLSEEMKSY